MSDQPARSIDRRAAEEHWRWLQRGRVGAGRLVAEGLDVRGCRLDGEKLNAARFSRIDLSGANLSYTVLDESVISDCDLTQAQLSSVGLAGAIVERCVFRSAQAYLLNAGGSRISDCDFRAAGLERTSWRDAVVTRCDFARASFGHAQFDRAQFTDCDFRSVHFRPVSFVPPVSMVGAVFQDCDFRDADLTDAVPDGAVFRGCRFDGASGTPYAALAAEFHPTWDARHPLESLVDGTLWRVRVNEFPEEPTPYSLLIADQVVADLMAWPPNWKRPKTYASADDRSETAHDAHEAAQFKREQAHDELTRSIPPSKRVK